MRVKHILDKLAKEGSFAFSLLANAKVTHHFRMSNLLPTYQIDFNV
jgi:hypothetical protein